jgi:hypothetical protein
MLTMSTPAPNFAAVCGNANLPLNGTNATYLNALKGPGVALGPSLTPADLKERFGALTWVRHTVANAIDPLTWPVMLGAPLLAVLRSLYSIPPQRPDAPAGETDLHRLAHMVSLFLPDGLSTASASATPAPPTTPGGGIITPRPAAPPPAPATTPTAAPAPPPDGPPPTPPGATRTPLRRPSPLADLLDRRRARPDARPPALPSSGRRGPGAPVP